MTAPGALPTREEIAALLFTAHEQWLGEGLHSTYMERGIVTWDKVALQTQKAYFVMADALLARLRPAWERLRPYVGHMATCLYRATDLPEGDFCTCGVSKVRQEIDAALACPGVVEATKQP